MAGPLELDPTPASVRRARRWSQERAAELGAPGAVDTVGLLVSELVSNVVLHARTRCTVALVRLGDHLRVEVSDASSRAPSLPRTAGDPLAQSGRGMAMVARLASSHGTIDRGEHGKTVWFELPVVAPRGEP
jgi:anti-sigma regulatory factor (Ser/Thr protein kinase)